MLQEPVNTCKLFASVVFTAKTETAFCTKVSTVNNKRCVELLENFAGRQQEGEQGAAGTMGLPWQPLPATELCTLGLPGRVVPTQHKSHGALQPRGILHSKHWGGQRLQSYVSHTGDGSPCGLVVGSRSAWAPGVCLPLPGVSEKQHHGWQPPGRVRCWFILQPV